MRKRSGPPRRLAFIVGMGSLVAASGGCSGGFDGCKASRTCAGTYVPSPGGYAGSGGGAGFATGGSGGDIEGVAGASAGTPSAGAAGEAGQGGDGSLPESAGGTPSEGGEAGVPGGAGSGAGGEPEPPDTTPPVVVSISPADGAHAVRIDTDIVVTFSEAMDQPETEASFECDACLPSHTTFEWSEGGTVMTVHSPGAFEYQEVGAATVLTYSFSITTFARDLAGNHLRDDRRVSFDTGHVYTTTIAPSDLTVIHHTATDPNGLDAACTGSGGQITASDAILLTFSFDDILQSSQVVDWVSATLQTPFTTTSAYLTSLGVYRVSVSPADLTWDVPVLENLGTLNVSNSVQGHASIDATNGVRDDFVNRSIRANRTQYLIHFVSSTTAMSIPLSCGPLSSQQPALLGAYVAP